MVWMAAATLAGNLWAANKQRKASANRRRNDMKLAEEYGIHPLAAWSTAGTPMGDGGYGMMASGFDKAASYAEKRRQEKRQDELRTQDVLHQMVLQEDDPKVKRALAEDILGYKMPASINQTTLTGKLGGAIDSANEQGGKLVDDLGNSVGVGLNVVREELERGLNWLHRR